MVSNYLVGIITILKILQAISSKIYCLVVLNLVVENISNNATTSRRLTIIITIAMRPVLIIFFRLNSLVLDVKY